MNIEWSRVVAIVKTGMVDSVMEFSNRLSTDVSGTWPGVEWLSL